MYSLTKFAPLFGIAGLILAWIIYAYVKKQNDGNETMREIAEMIHKGAMVFLRKEYSILVIFIVVVFLLMAWKIDIYTAIAFVSGALSSMLAGFFGMNAATRANVRTSQAAFESGQAKALNVAFFGGSVMGLSVASLGLLGLGIFYLIFGKDPATAKVINGYAMGASSIALFARIGGGIYTKSADVGAWAISQGWEPISLNHTWDPSWRRLLLGPRRASPLKRNFFTCPIPCWL